MDLKPFSETISTGTNLYQAPGLSQRMIWKGYKNPVDILTIPEQYRTDVQKTLVETNPEKIKKIPGAHRTAQQKEIMRKVEQGEAAAKKARQQERAYKGGRIGTWERWPEILGVAGTGGKWLIRFPGLGQLLSKPRGWMLAETIVETIERALRVGRGEIATAVKKAVTRNRMTELEGKILQRLLGNFPYQRIKHLVERPAPEKKGEYYHRDKGWY